MSSSNSVHRRCLHHAGLLSGLGVLSIALLMLLGAAPAPVAGEQARPGDCVACHGAARMLPADHVPTASMGAADCLQCHEPGTPLALAAKIPLSHQHHLHGITCSQCHPDSHAPAPLTTEQCLACHGTLAQVAARTQTTQPTNPHATPHGKTYTACDLCHHLHTASENFCVLCHDFTFTVP